MDECREDAEDDDDENDDSDEIGVFSIRFAFFVPPRTMGIPFVTAMALAPVGSAKKGDNSTFSFPSCVFARNCLDSLRPRCQDFLGFLSQEVAETEDEEESLGSRNEEKRGKAKEPRGEPGSERIIATVEGVTVERVADMAKAVAEVSNRVALGGDGGLLL